MAEFIYTMRKVRKAHGDKVILDDVTLSFLPGAKIGVVGPNGAGKSSVLRIMAGLDQPNNGDAFLAPGATVGILLQEPPLNEEKTVRGNVEEGLGDIKVKLDRFNEVAELMATDYSDELMEEMGRLQEELDHADAWWSDRSSVDSDGDRAIDHATSRDDDIDNDGVTGDDEWGHRATAGGNDGAGRPVDDCCRTACSARAGRVELDDHDHDDDRVRHHSSACGPRSECLCRRRCRGSC